MSREIRKVPADWQHPRYADDHYEQHLRGRYIGLFDGGFAQADKEWNEGRAAWLRGECENYGEGGGFKPIPDKYKGMRYTEYSGARPSPDDYMPEWADAERTHLMMYETTSEGTPISPAFETPEELARWLADNNASAFGGMTATYEQWLATCRSGWAPSAIGDASGLRSGVEAMAENQ